MRVIERLWPSLVTSLLMLSAAILHAGGSCSGCLELNAHTPLTITGLTPDSIVICMGEMDVESTDAEYWATEVLNISVGKEDYDKYRYPKYADVTPEQPDPCLQIGHHAWQLSQDFSFSEEWSWDGDPIDLNEPDVYKLKVTVTDMKDEGKNCYPLDPGQLDPVTTFVDTNKPTAIFEIHVVPFVRSGSEIANGESPQLIALAEYEYFHPDDPSPVYDADYRIDFPGVGTTPVGGPQITYGAYKAGGKYIKSENDKCNCRVKFSASYDVSYTIEAYVDSTYTTWAKATVVNTASVGGEVINSVNITLDTAGTEPTTYTIGTEGASLTATSGDQTFSESGPYTGTYVENPWHPCIHPADYTVDIQTNYGVRAEVSYSAPTLFGTYPEARAYSICKIDTTNVNFEFTPCY
jgi:hypothetical protein